MLSRFVIKDLVDLFADPDYINQTMLWLVRIFLEKKILIKNFFFFVSEDPYKKESFYFLFCY